MQIREIHSYTLASTKEGISDKACSYQYEYDAAFLNDKELFKKYFAFKEQHYYDFINANLPKDSCILGIGSGRGVVEYYLKKHGYDNIACSDLTVAYYPDSLGVPYIRFNALEDPHQHNGKYNAIICFALLYFFDDSEMETFFGNMAKLLPKGGVLIIDPAGSPDTPFSFFINNICLYSEMWLYRLYRSISDRKWYYISTIHAGYRRTDRELTTIAQRHGLSLEVKKNYAHLIDFERSMVYRKIVGRFPIVGKICTYLFGERLPYVRLFKFRRVD